MKKSKAIMIAALSLAMTAGAMTAQAASAKNMYLVSTCKVQGGAIYGNAKGTVKHTYDSSGRVTTSKYTGLYYGGTGTYTYKYGTYGKKMLKRKWDYEGTYTDKYTIKKTKSGYSVKEVNSSGATNYKYDKNGRLLSGEDIKKITYDKKGNMKQVKFKDVTYTYTYDSKGNMLTQKGTDKYKQVNKYTYDKNGNVKKLVSKDYEDGKLTNKTTYTYTYVKKRVPAGKVNYVKLQQYFLRKSGLSDVDWYI